MDKLQELLNFTNAEGEVITVFDGKMTLSQLVVIILTLAVVIFALKVFKKAVKWTVIAVALCVCLVHYNIASPEQIRDVATQVASVGVGSFQAIADSSKNIRIEGGSIEINLNDNWVDISEISSIVGGESGKATVVVGDQSYVVDDTAIIKLIKSFK